MDPSFNPYQFFLYPYQFIILENKEESSKNLNSLNTLNDNLSIKSEPDASNTPSNLNELNNQDELNGQSNQTQPNQQNLNSQQTNSINQLNNNLNNNDDLLKGVDNSTTEFNTNGLIKNEFGKLFKVLFFVIFFTENHLALFFLLLFAYEIHFFSLLQ